MWHKRMHDVIVATGTAFIQEVNVAPWLPAGWGGTADWLLWDDFQGWFNLKDLKTIKPEGLRWIKDGPKEEHLWQLSAYWHGLTDGGFKLGDVIEVMYLPMGDTNDDEIIEPIMVGASPLDRDLVWGVMEDRWAATQRYMIEIDSRRYPSHDVIVGFSPHDYLNEFLAPPMEREQKVNWNGKQGVWDVKLVPHWSSMFCPFENELCDCSEAGVTKIGHYTLDGMYVPRSGYDSYFAHVRPDETEVRKRRGASSVPVL
jgi:hypothetical protein